MSPVQCIPKKCEVTVVANDKSKLILIRTITGWRVCIDYKKLNKAIRKDQLLLPFIDLMFDKLAGKEYYYFLDKYLCYNQIVIAL